MGGPALNRTLSCRDGLHVVAEHREYDQAAVLDLLHLQLSESVRIVSQNQRVEGFTRVEEILTCKMHNTTRGHYAQYFTRHTLPWSTLHLSAPVLGCAGPCLLAP